MSQRAKQVATEISELLPTFLRYMYPYVFGPIPVPPSQVIAMVSIQEKKSCTLTELRHEMHVSAPTVSGIVDRLSRDGYIKRCLEQSIFLKGTECGSEIVYF